MFVVATAVTPQVEKLKLRRKTKHRLPDGRSSRKVETPKLPSLNDCIRGVEPDRATTSVHARVCTCMFLVVPRTIAYRDHPIPSEILENKNLKINLKISLERIS